MESVFRHWFEEIVGNIEIVCTGGMLGVGGDGNHRAGKGMFLEKMEARFLSEGQVEKNQIGHAFIQEGSGFG